MLTKNKRSIAQVVRRIKLKEDRSDFGYWKSISYEERISVLEEIRQEFSSWKYGNEQRFQRVYTIVKRK